MKTKLRLKGLIELFLKLPFGNKQQGEKVMGKAESLASRKETLLTAQGAATDDFGNGMYDDGVASVPPVIGADPDEQAKIDAAVAQAVGPLNDQIAQLQLQVSQDASDLEKTKGDDAAALDSLKVSDQEAFDKEHAAGTAAISDLNDRLTSLAAAKNLSDAAVNALKSVADKAQEALDNLKAFIIVP